MSHTMFSYNQDEAVKAGVSNFVSESGGYAGRVLTMEWTVSPNKGTKAVEISFETQDGLKANYLTIYYQRDNGEMLSGSKMLNAIMGVTQLQNLTSVKRGDQYFCPEIENKPIGLILQKVLYTKGDGSDGYKFEIRLPFVPNTGKTLAEQLGGKDAVAVNNILRTLTDKDERQPSGNQPYQESGVQEGVPDNWGENW